MLQESGNNPSFLRGIRWIPLRFATSPLVVAVPWLAGEACGGGGGGGGGGLLQMKAESVGLKDHASD
jgi:hypothetical protein